MNSSLWNMMIMAYDNNSIRKTINRVYHCDKGEKRCEFSSYAYINEADTNHPGR
jgi:hypothetical protein